MAERHKICTRCGERKPWSQYYAAARWPDGTMRRPGSRCKECDLARLRQRDKENPEAKRTRQREWARKQWQDPEARAILRDQRRQAFRRANNVTPDRYRVGRGLADGLTNDRERRA